MTYSIVCPYCSHAIKVMDYEEGYQAVVCTACNLPFMNKTTMSPVFRSFALVGVESERTLPTMEEIKEAIHEDPEQILCVDCGKLAVPGSAFRLCAECAEDEPENQPLPISTNSVFLQCPMSKNTTYRLDGDHVEVKYKKSTPVTTTRSDIHMLCEEDNPTSSIKELLGPDANTNKVAALNAVVRAVKAGLVEV